MRATVGVTDNRWAAFLRDHPSQVEANFWLPSGASFRSLSPGEPFLFKTKAPGPQLVGGGFFEGYLELRVSDAWAFFGLGNGVATEDELHSSIQEYRAKTLKPYVDDPTIGCVMLNNIFFAAPGDEMAEPPHWAKNIVTWKNYAIGAEDFDYVWHAFDMLRGDVRVDVAWEREPEQIVVELAGPRYGMARAGARHRLGQGAFRATVQSAYSSRCAITTSKIAPILEAAHIHSYAKGGSHAVTNGMLLRSDVHKLFDTGYLGVDPDYRLRVSPRLRIDWGNGVEFYEREARGATIELPLLEDQHPDPEALRWHMTNVFLAA